MIQNPYVSYHIDPKAFRKSGEQNKLDEEKMTIEVAVELGKQYCKANGFKYIGTCDIFGLKAMRDIASDRLMSDF